MLKTKTMDRVCCAGIAAMLILSVLMWGVMEPLNVGSGHAIGYEDTLFDQSRVHTIEIYAEDWDALIANAAAEEYIQCDIVIDGERLNTVAIRAKGNTSLSSVATMGSTRYSFKVEFDHYVKGRKYHGLDKLSLNNLIQDATMMKDYLAYTLMNRMGVPASKCAYVQISVNGEPWGLYLAVEGVEDSFLDRNGMTKGELYKPDSLSFGGGRGNGRDFDIEQFRVEKDEDGASAAEDDASARQNAQPGGSFGGFSGFDGSSGFGDFGSFGGFDGGSGFSPFGGDGFSGFGSFGGSFGEFGGGSVQMPADGVDFGGFGGAFGGFNFGMGNDDVKLIYTDDDFDSYSNIFDNAKTKIKDKDKARLIESLRKLNAKEDLDSVVNKDEVITYLAVHSFLCNNDSYTGSMVHNYYLYEEKGKLTIIPWDYNLAFGTFSASTDATSSVNSPIDSPVSGGTADSRPLIGWIFSDEEALAQYHETYSRFLEENIENGWIAQEIDRVEAMIAPYVEQDPSAFYSYEEFVEGVKNIRAYCLRRGESVRGQLEGDIPSTSAGQQRSSALIDASDISTTAMGSMNGGAGGGMPGRRDDRQGGSQPSGEGAAIPKGITPPNGTTIPENMTPPNGATMPEGITLPDGAAMPKGMTPPESNGSSRGSAAGFQGSRAQDGDTQAPGFDAPGGFGGERDAQQTGQSFPWTTLAICTLVILAALLVARRAAPHS